MNKYKASYTIESTIVMTAIITVLFAVLYAFIIMYQHVYISYVASYGAQQGAITWVNSGLDVNNGSGDYKSELYYRITEFAGGGIVGTKKRNIEKCVKEKLDEGILSSENATVKVDFKNYVFQRQIHVEIQQKISIPFSGIVEFFNDGKGFVISAKAVAAVPEPTEFIRNCDYGIEATTSLISYLNKKLGISDGFNKLVSKIKVLG